MAEPSARERRFERTRDAILNATIDLIVEQGFNNLSLRKVAERVDYSPAGLYEYFGSKDELIAAACVEGDRRLGQYLRAVDTSLPLRDYLLELGLAYVRFARENPNQFVFLFTVRTIDASQELIDHLAIASEEEDSFLVLYRAVERGIDSGQIHARADYNAMDISYSLWALAHGMATLQLTYLQNGPFNYKSADVHTLEVFLDGLLSG